MNVTKQISRGILKETALDALFWYSGGRKSLNKRER